MQPKTLLLAALFGLVTAGPTYAFPPQGSASKPCSACHTLTKEEAKGILKNLVQKVLAVRPSEVKGLWEVDVEARGRKGPLYLDFSKKYLISGSVIQLDGMENLTRRRMSELNRVDVSQIPLDDALVLGKRDAKYRIIVFDDPECPFCKRLQPEMNKIVSQRKDVAFFIKMYPLPIHPTALQNAKAIVCEKSLQLLEDSLAGKPVPAPKCETKQVEENIALARKLGINSTPTLVFPDGRVSPGYKPADRILEMLGEDQAKSSQR